MSVQSVYTTQSDILQAVSDLQTQLKGITPKMLLYFASSSYAQDRLSQAMENAFSPAVVVGCSTAGELTSGKMLKNSIVAMAMDDQVIADVKVEVVENIKEQGDVKTAFRSFDGYFGESIATADPSKYVGIVLIDGLSASEEKIMDKIGDLTNCTFIGGSAGDDLQFKKTHVNANGKAYSDAAVLALLKPTYGFDIIKTQSFECLPKELTATKVNAETREVLEFDGLPATKAYAAALDIPPENLSNSFMTNPVGLVAENEIFVRSPQRVDGDTIIFYCNILEGSSVSLLQSKDIVKDTQAAVENKLKEMGKFSCLINFHCILRTLELEQKNQTEAYGKIFTNIPTLGFSTYGEEYLGHINQTSTILVLK